MASSQAFTVTALAAGATSGNILVGSMFEFVSGRPRAIQVWGIQDPPTTAVGLIRLTYGTVVAIEDGYPLQIASAANIGPNKSDHEIVSFMASPGDRIVLNVRNAGSTALTARFVLKHQDF